MPRFQFSLRSTDTVQAGVVQSDSFTDALSAISEHALPATGDTLEIGVQGFPPARFEFADLGKAGAPGWRPWGKQAA